MTCFLFISWDFVFCPFSQQMLRESLVEPFLKPNLYPACKAVHNIISIWSGLPRFCLKIPNPESRYAVGVGTSTILTTFQIFSSHSNNIYTRTSYRVHLTETHRKTKETPGNVKQNRVLVRKASQNDERERCSPSLGSRINQQRGEEWRRVTMVAKFLIHNNRDRKQGRERQKAIGLY